MVKTSIQEKTRSNIVVAQLRAALALLGLSVLSMTRRDKMLTESVVFAAHWSVEKSVEIPRIKTLSPAVKNENLPTVSEDHLP